MMVNQNLSYRMRRDPLEPNLLSTPSQESRLLVCNKRFICKYSKDFTKMPTILRRYSDEERSRLEMAYY